MACVTIWANSMAATAGESQPFELSTSTQACMRRIALLKISSVSPCSSGPNCRRDKCACNNKFVLI